MAERLGCLAPGCRRSRPADGIWREWICQRHWAPVPRALKAELAQRRRLATRHKGLWPDFEETWAKCREAAIVEVLQGVGL